MSKKVTHYTCNNTVICNKYGYQPGVDCMKHKCKFVAKTEIEIADKPKVHTEW